MTSPRRPRVPPGASVSAEGPPDAAGTDAAPEAHLRHLRHLRRRPSDLKMLQEALRDCDTDDAVIAALQAVAPSCMPSKAAVTKLICQYSHDGCWRRGVALFRHLDILGVAIDLPLSNAALWACSRGGDAAEACRIFEDAQGLQQNPDRITYRALFRVLAAQGLWAPCVRAFVVSWNDGVLLDGDSCLCMLLMLRRAGHWQLAEACLLAELCKLKGSCRSQFTDLAGALHSATAPVPPASCTPDVTIARALLEKVRGAPRSRRSAAAAGAEVPPHVCGACGDAGDECAPVLAVHADAVEGPDARGLVEDALVTPCCNVLLQAYADAAPPQPDRALRLLRVMSSVREAAPRGPLQPDTMSFGLVALAHCRAGLVSRGLDVLAACARSGQPPPAAVYSPCIAAAASAGDGAAAVEVWRHMHACGLQPDDACGTAFIAAAARSGHAGVCAEAVPAAGTLSSAAIGTPGVLRDVGTLLITLAQHGAPPLAVAAVQTVLAAGVPVPAAYVTECVRQLECRDALCCAALRQTAAVAGLGHETAPAHAPGVTSMADVAAEGELEAPGRSKRVNSSPA